MNLPPTHASPGPGDFYLENGFMVFTEAYHLKRGYCCQNRCRHCPFGTRTDKPTPGQSAPPAAAPLGSGDKIR